MKANKKIKLVPPYTPDVNTRLNPELNKYRGKPGAYIIVSRRTNEIKYIGQSGYNVIKTMIRHFQNWDDPRQKRFVYSRFHVKVRVIETKTARRAALLEEILIKKYEPVDNLQKLELFKVKKQDLKACDLAINEDCPF